MAINDYQDRLSDWNNYITEISSTMKEAMDDILELDQKRIDSANANDIQKAQFYCEETEDRCEEAINELSQIYAPEISKDHYNYLINYFTKYKQWCNYIANPSSTYDNSKAQSLFDDSQNYTIQASQEAERIRRQLNKEAEKLGLVKPFP